VKIGILTGSGTYALPGLRVSAVREIPTRFGTVELSEGTLGDAQVVHLSRHGPGHVRLSNHVEHRANVLALREAGVEAAIGVSVCGAVDPSIELGCVIVFDDLHFPVNRLPDGSICTLHEQPGAPGRGHWIYESPFSSQVRDALLQGARAAAGPLREDGCYGHVDGPRFNTRSEIAMLARCGVSAVSQTAGPETVLCGEAGLPYALLGYATDYANGVKPEPTLVSELTRLMQRSTSVFAAVLPVAVAQLAALDSIEPVGARLSWD
jgi:5'-methylthioadenosine phosphorylase